MIRRILEAGMKTLPLMALLFLPIAWGPRVICTLRHSQKWWLSVRKLQYQQLYLAAQLFLDPGGNLFHLWLTMAFLLGSWSRKEEETGNPRLAWKSRQLRCVRRGHLRHQPALCRGRLGHVARGRLSIRRYGDRCSPRGSCSPGWPSPWSSSPWLDRPAAAGRGPFKKKFATTWQASCLLYSSYGPT